MRILVLWEDQCGVQANSFGPGILLIQCVADETSRDLRSLLRLIESHPKKGVGNVRDTLHRHYDKLSRDGPVVAVVDRDKILDLWDQSNAPPDCRIGISARFHQDAAGGYELIFLERNVETLIKCACDALGDAHPAAKPNPDQRDRYLGRVAWWSDRSIRDRVRESCPSFDRVVRRVADQVNQIP